MVHYHERTPGYKERIGWWVAIIQVGGETVKDCTGIRCLLDSFYRNWITRLKEMLNHISLHFDNFLKLVDSYQVI